MNLRHLSDKALLQSTTNVVRIERESLASGLHHFLEIERRKLFADLKFESLYEFLIEHHKYSEREAYARIAAMRLLQDLPEIETKIDSGALTLTNLNMAKTLFRSEELSKGEQLKILDQIANTSSRTAAKILSTHSTKPNKKIHERLKEIAENEFELRTTVNKKTAQNLKRLKGLLAHSDPDITLGELIEKMADIVLEKWDPALKKVRRSHRAVETSQQSVPAKITRLVWRRAKSKCENCGSVYALQTEHRIPRALKGTHELKNLRLYCRNCNQRAAITIFGAAKMRKYRENL